LPFKLAVVKLWSSTTVWSTSLDARNEALIVEYTLGPANNALKPTPPMMSVIRGKPTPTPPIRDDAERREESMVNLLGKGRFHATRH
jgi:hypothetical protein